MLESLQPVSPVTRLWGKDDVDAVLEQDRVTGAGR
jgi:hypothetical protein